MKIDVMLSKNAKMPTKAHEADAGFDLYAPEDISLKACGCVTVNTGVHMAIPEGYVGFLKSKSGLNVKCGIRSEGVIDSGYTGAIIAKLYNDSNVAHEFKAGDKIIQIVILPIPEVWLNEVQILEETERSDNGFGSSGR